MPATGDEGSDLVMGEEGSSSTVGTSESWRLRLCTAGELVDTASRCESDFWRSRSKVARMATGSGSSALFPLSLGVCGYTGIG